MILTEIFYISPFSFGFVFIFFSWFSEETEGIASNKAKRDIWQLKRWQKLNLKWNISTFHRVHDLMYYKTAACSLIQEPISMWIFHYLF